MSDSIFRIWSIARYEAKVIMRGWLFRIAFLLPLIFLSLFLFTGIFVNSFTMHLYASLFMINAPFPWFISIVFTVYASVVIAAVSTDSGTGEWRLDTLEALRVRPWLNLEYTAGKLIGQTICFSLMTTAVLLLAAGISFFSPGELVFWAGYLLYPLIICVPAFLFVAGISLIVARVVRNQMVALTIVTGILLLLISSANAYHHLLDISALQLPLFFSSITGFSFPELIARQRLLFLCLGLMLAALSWGFACRPTSRRSSQTAAFVISFLFLLIAAYSGISYLDHFQTGSRIRERMRGLNDRLRPVTHLEPLSYDIDVKQNGRGIDCKVTMVLENKTGSIADRYVCTLNPGLSVVDVGDGTGAVEFEQECHVLTVFPRENLKPGERDTVVVRYAGIVDQRAMFSDLSEDVRNTETSFSEMHGWSKLRSFDLFKVPRDFAPLRYDYMLLLPEAMWYPVPGLPYDPRNPQDERKVFSQFSLGVSVREGLNAVSQGERTEKKDGGFLFEPEYPLTGVTLAVGNFRTRTIEIDSLEYNLYSTPGSEELLTLLECAADTLPGTIAAHKDKLEYSLGLSYPFRRMTFIEVPATFNPFNRPLRNTGFGNVQPEIVLVRENGIMIQLAGVPSRFDMNKRNQWNEEGPLDERNRRSAISALKSSTHQFVMNRGQIIYPMYFDHCFGIESEQYPHLGLLFEYLAGMNVLTNSRRRDLTGDGFTDGERASRLIHGGDFIEGAMDPKYFRWAGNMVGYWAGHHYYLIDEASDEGILERFIRDIVESNRFRSVDEAELLELFAERFGFRLESILIGLDEPADIPGFVYGGFSCCEIIEGEKVRYRVDFEMMNREDVSGVVAVSAALRIPKAIKKMMKRKVLNPVVAIEAFEPGEWKHVEFMLDYAPVTLWINTMISRNVPSKIIWRANKEAVNPCRDLRWIRPGIDQTDIDAGKIVIDDRDPGFKVTGGTERRFIRDLLPGKDKETGFIAMNDAKDDPPSIWRKVVNEQFFGAYERSAVLIRAGNGSAIATWTASIPENGYYDVYCHVFERYRNHRLKNKDGENYGFDRIEHHYTVHHSDGSSEVMLKPDQCEDGWNLVGKYYFEEGEAVVELSDESPVLYVIADAVKWVKKD